MKSTIAGFCLVAGFTVASAPVAQAQSILVQDARGSVYSVNTGTGAATLFRSLTDVPGQNGNSPNALGYHVGTGALYRADFAASPNGSARLYRDDDELGTIPNGSNGFAVAAGDVVGNTYAYVDRNSNLRTVSNIDTVSGGSISVSGPAELRTATPSPLGIMGDIAFSSTGVFAVAHSTNSGRFVSLFNTPDNLASLSATLTATKTLDVDVDSIAGLAYAGGTLYGITGGSADGNLTNESFVFSINTLTGDVDGYKQILSGEDPIFGTDAAVVPLPAAAWMFLGGLGAILIAVRRRLLGTPAGTVAATA